jgi:regulatory protein
MDYRSFDRNTFILNKAKAYCAYQERCIADIKKKLTEWKVKPEVSPKVIHQLQQEDFINEERFARVFAGGKFRIKKWGRKKIIAALRAKGIQDIHIETGLEEISEDEYLNTLKLLIEKKKQSMKDRDSRTARNKLISYMISRGYEQHLIFDNIQDGQ